MIKAETTSNTVEKRNGGVTIFSSHTSQFWLVNIHTYQLWLVKARDATIIARVVSFSRHLSLASPNKTRCFLLAMTFPHLFLKIPASTKIWWNSSITNICISHHISKTISLGKGTRRYCNHKGSVENGASIKRYDSRFYLRFQKRFFVFQWRQRFVGCGSPTLPMLSKPMARACNACIAILRTRKHGKFSERKFLIQ